MGTADEQDSDTGRPADRDAGTEPVGDSISREVWMDRAVLNWMERAREVTDRIARGELEQMVELLLDDDKDKRYEVANDIAKGGREVIPRAIELAEDARPRMREMACYILGQVGYPDPDYPLLLIRHPDGIPTLLKRLVSDIDAEVRAAAAYALSFHKVRSAAPALCRAASDPSCEVRYSVAIALRTLRVAEWEDEKGRSLRGEVTAALLRLMDDEDDDVRDWATFGLSKEGHDTPQVRARLWKALDDPYAGVRGGAARGLAELGDRALIPRLEKLLREDEDLSEYYFWAARELRDPILLPAVREAAERWRQGMEEGEKLDVFIAAAVEDLEEAAASPGERSETSCGEGYSSDDGS
jgi:HEAT repeat protein